MYSEMIVNQRLAAFAREFKWMPEYHSLDEVSEFKETMDRLIKIESNSKNSYATLTRTISSRHAAEIKRYVENEQVLCALDSNYWETRYAWVCDEEGRIYKFQPRLSQRIYNSVLADFDEKQVSIELLILKGRQLGITTQTALKFIHRLLFLPHTQAIMASVKEKSSQLIERILNTAHNKCPFWLVPMRGSKGTFQNGSVLSIQSGMQATGLAQGWTPTCLVPSTRVRLGNGSTAEIKNITAGDIVITDSGKIARVSAVRKMPRKNAATRSIKLWGNYENLECTVDHRIKTPDGWQEIAELSVGDYVCHPVRQISKKSGAAVMQKLLRGKVDAAKMQKVEIPFTEMFGYLCGFYLAEGTVHESAIGHKTKKPYISQFVFSMHKSEVEHRAKKLREIFGDEFKFRTTFPSANGAKIDVNCAWMARWVAEHFGRKENKTIPDWAWSAGREFCLGIVNGYLDGDGCYEMETNTIRAKSISNALILQMRDLVASVGFGWSSIYSLPQKQRDSSVRKPTWELALNGPTGYAYRRKFCLPTQKMKNGLARHWRYVKNNEIEIMIEGVEDSNSESVYDLEVESEDRSFTTVHCAVHNCAHLSELADIPNPIKTIEEGLMRAMHISPALFLALEGTGGGNTGWLADTWRAAKKGFPKGQHRLCPVFISWPCCPEIYPKQGFLDKFPIPGTFLENRLDATRKHVAKCEAYIRSQSYLSRIMGTNYRMPIEQQWFWEWNYRQAAENHTQRTWAAQMPGDDSESLTGQHDSVVSPEVIMELEDRVYEIRGNVRARREEPEYYAITGHDIDESLFPATENIDERKPILEIEWKSHRGQSYKWELIPLLSLDEDEEKNTLDRLILYERPRKGSNYSCGIDTADGLGEVDEDRSCISVTKNNSGSNPDYQVCEFTTNRLNSAQITAFAAAIGAMFSPYCRDSRGIKFAIEQIRGPGDTCQHQLKMMGFIHHHDPQRYDGKKIHEKPGTKQGWFSTAWSVPMLMTRFIEAVNGGWYIPKSRYLIEEIRTLERHVVGSKSKMEHRAGQHDDRVRAAAQSYFTVHDKDILAERAQKRYAQPTKKKENAPKRSAGQVSVGDW